MITVSMHCQKAGYIEKSLLVTHVCPHFGSCSSLDNALSFPALDEGFAA